MKIAHTRLRFAYTARNADNYKRATKAKAADAFAPSRPSTSAPRRFIMFSMYTARLLVALVAITSNKRIQSIQILNVHIIY